MSVYDNLPAKLRETGLFCCWRREQRGERSTKVPYNPQTGRKARSTDPATFAPFPTALEAAGRYDGLGVGVFGALGAIDIDHCLGPDGRLSDMAQDVVATMRAYTERSPGGTGLRILFTAEGFQYDKDRYYINNQQLGLEVYIAGSTNKYVTVTGATSAQGVDLEERGEQLAAVLERYMVRPKKQQAPAPARQPMDLDDMALVEKIKRSKGGDTFRYLWDGQFVGFYKSHSEADQALCNILAWWTNRDAERMDRLFRQSGLMREKWDRPTAGSTYGQITVQEAIDSCQGGYDPQAHFKTKADKITIETAEGTRTLADLHPERNDRYSWSDIGNGNLFADVYKEVLRFSPERKKWFVYDGVAWRPDTGNLRAMELCKKLADELLVYALSLTDELQRQTYLEFVRRWQVRRNREIVLKDASSVYPVSMDQFDANPYLFNCKNGVLDLRSNYFRPHSPADMLTKVSGVNYDPDAKSELWEKFVEDIMQGDVGKTLFLQKSFGYGLTGDTSQECLFILYGPSTRNGKGTLAETFLKVLGTMAGLPDLRPLP